jgi:hypothetical protein
MVDTVDSKSAAGTRREGSIPSSPTYQPPFSGEVMFAMAAGHPQTYSPTLTIVNDSVGSADNMPISRIQIFGIGPCVEIGAGGRSRVISSVGRAPDF